jgi:hypothetical protein
MLKTPHLGRCDVAHIVGEQTIHCRRLAKMVEEGHGDIHSNVLDVRISNSVDRQTTGNISEKLTESSLVLSIRLTPTFRCIGELEGSRHGIVDHPASCDHQVVNKPLSDAEMI